MLSSLRSAKNQRIVSTITAALCLFWNVIGISVHDHDIDGLQNYAPAAMVALGAAHSGPAVIREAALTAPVRPDQCPGCEYQLGSVSGALSAYVPPTYFTVAVILMPQTASLIGRSTPSAASRGPPAA